MKMIRNACQRCRYLAKRTIEVAMGPTTMQNMMIVPAFYYTQLDLSGPFSAYSPHQKRKTVKIWLVVFCCCITSTTSIKVMDDYSTDSFVQTFTRFACDVGFPRKIMCDSVSQLIKGCESIRLSFRDIKSKLFKNVAGEFVVFPVGGHNMHGKVERKIEEVNASLDKSIHNERLSLLQLETLSAVTSNCINDLPLALENVTSVFECMDIITPNRLRLGRNNNRSPTGEMVVCKHSSKILHENAEIYNVWFETWLLCHVPKLKEQQKWFRNENIISDVVLFLKNDPILSTTYLYGMVVSVERSKDDVVRKVKVKYRNLNEEVFRETFRPVRSLVVTHRVDESDVMTEMGEMVMKVDSMNLK